MIRHLASGGKTSPALSSRTPLNDGCLSCHPKSGLDIDLDADLRLGPDDALALQTRGRRLANDEGIEVPLQLAALATVKPVPTPPAA